MLYRDMASTYLAKLKESLTAKAQSEKVARKIEKVERGELIGKGTAVGGTMLAAYLDKTKAEEPEAPYKIKGVPVNLTAGAAGVLGSILWEGMPGRHIVGGAFLGQFLGGVYRATYDHIEHPTED